MITGENINERTTRMRAGLSKAYGIKASDLAGMVDKAGRRLPGHVQRKLEPLLEAEAMGGHPRLLQRVDARKLNQAERALIRHLATVDRSAARRAAVSDWATRLGLSLLVVFIGVGLWVALRLSA
jgi:hypothetical protein